ncbi:MAG: ATP-dependent helicase [Microbacterium sp.]|uniref:ATP-dependent helicase n=1 Tax=Microbacterium sp. TaxID=51671 RepID=UPI001AD015D8|nr:ATP-dependent DNA helicase [Microbacterium sp.]MBN9176005.1 ATP-dependent helicase [Microbacterium sp.]
MPLDPAQHAAVSLPLEASGVVVGAPGSGKTTVIVERVAALLAAGARPEEVLVLTPTRQSATELRDRLALAVRVATPGPLARSLAAFAYQLVRAHAVHTGAEPPQLLTGPDEDGIVQDLLDGDAEDEVDGRRRWPDWLSPDVRSTRGFRAELRAFLAECTTLGIRPERLRAHARAQDRDVWIALASFADDYHAVRSRMRGAHRDAAGLVREAVDLARVLPPGDVARGTTAHVRALLVDDAQELTLGGVELLEACRANGVAVLAFGDPDIGSGAFRGARPENFARLASGVPVHVLDGSHRGTAAQRALAADVISRIGAGGVAVHRRAPEPPPPEDSDAPERSVRAFALRSPGEEIDTIARLLRERHVLDGIPWDDCAVIAHDSRQVSTLEAELAARDVPTSSGQGRTLGETRAVRDLLRLVDLAAQESWSHDDAFDALRSGGLDPVELRRLRTALRHEALRHEALQDEAARPDAVNDAGPGLLSVPSVPAPTARELVASALAHPIEFELIDTREGRRAARIARTLAELRTQLADGATAHELLWTAWERSGWERSWRDAAQGSGPVADRARRDLDAVVALFQSAKRHGERADGTSALAFVRGVLQSDVAEDRLVTTTSQRVVRVLTPAGGIGAEFDTVVVAGVQDGVWPNLRTRGGLFDTWRLALLDRADSADALDLRRGVLHDELRLFARAVTRARARLIVTAVDDDDTGPSALFEFLPERESAPRAAEHPLSLRGLVALHRRTLTDSRSPEPARAHAAGQLALLAAAHVPGADPDDWYGLAERSSSGPLYDLDAEAARVSPSKLEAIDECQLNWVIGDLGGDSGSVGAGLGTLIHAALEHAEGADEDALWAAVEARWGELEFDAAWIERTERTRARDLVRRLARYLRDTEAAGTTLLGAEPHFELSLPVPGAAHPAVISGTIDRVELTAQGTVVIVDLKTGRTQPTGAAAAAANPQLSAYQLAFEQGAIPAASGHSSGGAKLLVLKQTRAAPYATPAQAPFDDETRAGFVDTISSAVQVMGGRAFLAPYEAHCRDDHTHGLCRIHTVGAVSSS